MEMLLPGIQPLPTEMDLLELARTVSVARKFHTWFCGMAVLCWMADLEAYVYRVPEHAGMEFYFPQHRRLTVRELPLHPKHLVGKGWEYTGLLSGHYERA
jgi:hypothetical protein